MYNGRAFRKRTNSGEAMKHRKILSAVFAGLGGCLAALALVICLTQRNAEPKLLVYPQEAVSCARNMLTSVCAGDFQAASQYLYGEPSLGTGSQWEDTASQYLWDAFVSSLDYQTHGGCYATASGVALKVTITGLDMGQVLQDMKSLAPELLEEMVNQAEDMDEVYDSDQEYRDEFIQSVMYRAAEEALVDADSTSQELTLSLMYDGSTWWVVPDEALLNAISGGILE